MCRSANYIVAIAVFGVTTQGAPTSTALASGENLLAPMAHTVFCLSYPGDCRQSVSIKLFADTPALHAELDSVNREVNASIAPQPDRATLDDKWLVAPLEGNCHDYAVTKRHYLLQAGWPSSSLLLAEVTLKSGEHHLILVAHTEGGEFILDNLDPDVVSMADTKSGYYWNRIQSSVDPKYWGSTYIGHENKMPKVFVPAT
jgi:predicted transglutaminase-like cysteine proteinase